MKKANAKNKSVSSAQTNTDSERYPQWHNLVSGAVAGAGARLVSAPFDLLKIRLQLQGKNIAPKYAGNVLQSFSKIVQDEGPTALFKGNVAATYLWIGYAAIQFGLYSRVSSILNGIAESAQSAMSYDMPEYASSPTISTGLYHDVSVSSNSSLFASILASNPSLIAFISGATAGVCATFLTYPFDICRTNFAAQTASADAVGMVFHKSLLSYVKYTLGTRGVSGFFVGVGPAIAQIIPYMGINFAVYDYIVRKSHNREVGGSGIAGAVAGATSKFLVYPLDTVKRRLQAQSFGRSIQPTLPQSHYNGASDCIRQIFVNEGASAFYKGLTPTVMKSAIATGASFATFSFTKEILEEMHDRAHGDRNIPPS